MANVTLLWDGRIWTDFCTSRIIPSFHRYLQFQPMSDTQGLAEVREEFLQNLSQLAGEMDAKGPYFFGKEPSLIDFVVAPWIVRAPNPTLHPPPSLLSSSLTLGRRCVSGSSTTTKVACRCRKKGKSGSA